MITKSSFVLKSVMVNFLIVIMILTIICPTKIEAAGQKYVQKVELGIENFPENYKKIINDFIDQTGYTNWTFQAYYTGIDWNDFVKQQAKCGRSRVNKIFDKAYRCTCNNVAGGYYCANSAITSYYMDPRNFINERNIFQFLNVSYNEQLYTKEIVHNLVNNYKVFNYGKPITFKRADTNKEVTMTYTDIIMEAAKITSMSPISMAIKIVQEVGDSGSGSTDGKNKKYPSTYNFFNIGATDTGGSGDPIENGLKYANSKKWNCPYTSIVGGAKFNSSDYIKAGQNTAYFYKFDCVGNKILNPKETQTITVSNLNHNYMTNIMDPYSQSAILFDTYNNNKLAKESLNFIIPVYDNMPENPVEKISTLSNSKQELYYANVSLSLNINNAPNGNYIGSIYRDDLVIMLKRNYKPGWDKVQLWE